MRIILCDFNLNSKSILTILDVLFETVYIKVDLFIKHMKQKQKNECIKMIESSKRFLDFLLDYRWFLKDHVTLKTGEIMQKIQLWSQQYITLENILKYKTVILNGVKK